MMPRFRYDAHIRARDKFKLKQRLPRIISHVEIVSAAKLWFDWAIKKRRSKYHNLVHYLENDLKYLTGESAWCTSDEGYRIVQLCLSPHYKALLTAYWIKKYNTKRPKHVKDNLRSIV